MYVQHALLLCILPQLVHCGLFYGGSMSFKVLNATGNLTVEVMLMTGWKLGSGPCGPSCSEANIGMDTSPSASSNPNYYGQWSLEISINGTNNLSDVTPVATMNRTEKLQMVSEAAGWEMEGAKIIFEIPARADYSDIIYTGNRWMNLSLMPNVTDWHMQVRVTPLIRSDTGKPNSSPVVLMKPFYRLERNRNYTIHIPVIDEDEDAVLCKKSKYIEAGSLLDQALQNVWNIHITQDCNVEMNMIPSFAAVNSTGAVAVTVKDYNRNGIRIGNTLQTGHSKPLSGITVQFFYLVVERAEAPEFVSPTPPSKTRYTLYIGVDFHIQVYAKPTVSGRTIKRLYFLRRDGEFVNVSQLTNSPEHGANVFTASGQWIPKEKDLGFHILCANVEDSAGFGCVDMRCFIIDVKAPLNNSLPPSSSVQSQLHFINFPEVDDINCKINSYCTFPILATSNQPGGVLKFEKVSASLLFDNMTVVDGGNPIPIHYHGQPAAKTKVEFYAAVAGTNRICIRAYDSSTSIVKCLDSNVVNRDPCDTVPCQQGGSCIANADYSNYKCICGNGRNGDHCENTIDQCIPSPCKNGGTCQPVGLLGIICLCKPGYTGIHCDHYLDKCGTYPCGNGGICDQNGTSPVCHCQSGYTGTTCDTAITNAGQCDSSSCSGNKICVNNAGTTECVCGVAYSSCSNEKAVYKSSNTMFVPPTPDDRSTINCNTINDQDCKFPIYVLSSEMPFVSKLFVSNDLHLTISIPTKTNISTSGQVYMMAVTIRRPSSITDVSTYDMCLQVSKVSSITVRADAKCFHIEFSNKGLAVTQPRTTAHDFIEPTPASESTITCELHGLCHFLVYTEATETGSFQCKQVVSSPEFPAGVSKPVVLKLTPVSAVCETNIVVKVTSSNTKRICLKSWEQGDSRCFQIMTLNNITNPCLSNPCKNGGVCQAMKDGSIKCHCASTFKGDFCEEGPCPVSSTTCKNSAHCHMDGNLEKCICPYGFWGNRCNHSLLDNATNTATDGGKFLSTSIPETVECYKDKACHIPLSVTGDHQSTELSASYVDAHVTVQSIDRQQHNPASPSTYTSVMTVVGKNPGTHKVCVQTNGINGRSGDEVCVNIHVKTGLADPVSKTQPYYLDPTLPNNAVVECIVNTQCHLKLWASDRDGCTDCPVVTPSEKNTKTVYIFQAIGKPLKCPTDVVIQGNTVQKKQFCFTLTSTTVFIGTKDGENRCYDIQFRSTSTAKSPCGTTVCENGGRCDGHSGVAVCTCLSGYSGSRCHDKHGLSQTVPVVLPANRNSTIFGDAAVPKEIHCQLSQPCSLPLTVFSSESPVLEIGSRDNSLNFSSPQLHGNTLTGTYHGKIDMVPGAIGTYHACVHTLNTARKINDEICFKVAVSNSNNNSQQHQNQPHFQSPTISGNSTVDCRPGQTCHMLMSLSPGMHGQCPTVRSTNPPPPFMHVTHSSENSFVHGNCTADVAIQPQTTKSGMETYCFQVYLPSVPGETRCINVNYAAKSPTQCVGKTCLNGGYCDSLQTNGNCICPTWTSGNMCETVVSQSTEGPTESDYTDDLNTYQSTQSSNLYSGSNACSSLAPASAKDHAKGGRIECECRDPVTSKTTLVVKRNVKASVLQIVRASAIGAAGCIGAITIAAAIYVLVGKLEKKLDKKTKPGKVNPRPKTSTD